MNSIIVTDFSLKHTLESGQFFRYWEMNGTYKIITQDKSFLIKQQENNLSFSTKAEFVQHFFSLDEKFCTVKKMLIKDTILNTLFTQYNGLRLIRQDPWECLIAFICSSASNIPKIKKNLARIIFFQNLAS